MTRMLAVAVSTSARRAVNERGQLVVTVIFYTVVVSVLGGLWRAAAGANGGEVAGYTAAALTWYATASEATTVPLNIRMIEVIGADIASGAVATELLRPASVLAIRVASAFGEAIPRLVACVAVGVIFSTVVAGAPPGATGALLALPSLLLAIACNLLAQHAVASVSFWLRDVTSAWFVYQKLVFVLGGMLLPLQVLPDPLERASLALPFMAMSYAPARLASGHVEPWLLAAQLAWLALLALAAHAAFTAGERRLQVVGG